MTKFKAKYAGKCGDCEAGIKVDEMVWYDHRILVHVECPDDNTIDLDSDVDVCRVCNYTKPCWCE